MAKSYRLRPQEKLDELMVICRPLSEDGLRAVIEQAITLYMDEQGITMDDLRKLGTRDLRPIGQAEIDAALKEGGGFRRLILEKSAPRCEPSPIPDEAMARIARDVAYRRFRKGILRRAPGAPNRRKGDR